MSATRCLQSALPLGVQAPIKPVTIVAQSCFNVLVTYTRNKLSSSSSNIKSSRGESRACSAFHFTAQFGTLFKAAESHMLVVIVGSVGGSAGEGSFRTLGLLAAGGEA